MNSKDITSKSKPTPENPITLHVSLTQRDGRIVRVGTLAMAVGGMSSSVGAQDAHQQPSKVFGLRQSLSSTKPGQLHRCSFSDCRRRPAGDETTIHFDGWSACRTSGLPTPQFRADHGLCGSWVLVPVPQRGLVLCNAHLSGDVAWSQSCRGLNHLDEKPAFRSCGPYLRSSSRGRNSRYTAR